MLVFGLLFNLLGFGFACSTRIQLAQLQRHLAWSYHTANRFLPALHSLAFVAKLINNGCSACGSAGAFVPLIRHTETSLSTRCGATDQWAVAAPCSDNVHY